MRVLMLCEGDAEIAGGSWSGISKSLLTHFRAEGHAISASDTDLYGAARLFQAGRAFSTDRARWGVKYHLGGPAFQARTNKARRAIEASRASLDAILQIGATFQPSNRGEIPYFLSCDSNILMAQHGAETGHSDATFLTGSQLRGIVERERGVYEGAAGIFTLSDRLRQSFIDDFGQSPDRVHTVGAGPNFDPEELPVRDWTKGGPPTVLFVGAKFARKGGDTLLEAFRRVRRRIPDARLLIIGPRNLVIEEAGVQVLGYLRKDVPAEKAQLAGAFAQADVFCLPTRFEPFGIVFLEAMYCGLPCLGTNVWAVPEMIEDGRTGFTCPAEDIACLEQRLVELLSDRDLAARMGAAGRIKASSTFTWPLVVKRMIDVMTERLPAKRGS